MRTPKLAHGELAYDSRAKSLPKVAKNGALVDSNGDFFPDIEQDIGSGLAASQARKACRQKPKLTVKPRQQSKAEDGDTINASVSTEGKVWQTGVAKRYSNGGRRYGVSRRVGNPRRKS